MPLGNVVTYTTSSETTDQAWIDWSVTYQSEAGTSIWGDWNNTYTTTGISDGLNALTWEVWNGYLAIPLSSVTNIQPCGTDRAVAGGGGARTGGARSSAVSSQEAARVACEKAEALLRAHLDAEQQAMLDREQAFLVSVTSGRKYKIKRGQRGNVKELDKKGREVRSFCIHPDDVPDQDAMLAQKLLLEHDEAAFRRTANITELQVA